LVLSSWLDSSQLSGANTEEEVIRRGFQFSPHAQGIKVAVGDITPQPPQKGRKPSISVFHFVDGELFYLF
jgi:hypothetical protein